MKKQKPFKYPPLKSSVMEMKEAAVAYEVEESPMIRTQIYLNKHEYDFVQREASRRDEPMAAVIRNFIDEKMELPDEAWTNNPMFKPWPADPDNDSPEDAAINHDHYLYGGPKKWIKMKGKYVEAPPLPEDYFDNRASGDAYDKRLRKMDETK
ncbi:MAG TPA: hypothetical protein VIK59_10025 [Verrucomicrobiae bacterium]